MKNIVDILNAQADVVSKAQADGIHIDGERYVLARIDGRSLYGRKVRWFL